MKKSKTDKINRLEHPLIEHTLDSTHYYKKEIELQKSNHEEQAKVLLDNHKMQKNISRILSKYSENHKESAIIPILTLCQVYNGGHLNEAIIKEVAEYLKLEHIKVFETATFYSLFNLQPQKKYQLCVCQGVSCLLNGYKEIIETINNKLSGTDEAADDKDHEDKSDNDVETTTAAMNLFSIKQVECLGACGGAPVMMINDEYYENLTAQSTLDLLNTLELSEKK